METVQIDLNTKLSAIDRALAAAQARKAAKESTTSDADTTAAPATDIEKTAAKLAKDAERQAAKVVLAAQREARKAAKAAEKATSNKPVHMKKIERAASKLPELNEQMQLLFNEATTNFSAVQLTALALHLQHFNRVKATERALDQKVEAGVQVQVIGGDPKYIGMTGTVSKAQRIRCFVEILGVNKPVYLFTSDVQVTSQEMQATGTEG